MNKKKIIKNIFFSVIFIIILVSFYIINSKNYTKIKEIKSNLVEHPDNLPTKEVAKYSSLGFKNLKADLYWLETIQYIGGNVLNSEYKKYLYAILDIITELNPHFEHPYIIGELLLPSYNERYEHLTKEERNKNTQQAIKIGLKGIKNFCDTKKIEAIKKEDNLEKLVKDEKYKNPCKSYKIPYGLAFIYFYYLKEPEKSALYYKIASANEDSIEGAKIMAAIMKGKGGNREKSFFMFLNMAQETEDKNKICSKFSKELIKASTDINGKFHLRTDTNFIKEINDIRKKLFSQKKDKKISDNISCISYLDKAVRELNLNYIELANKKFKEKTGKNSYDAKELLEKKYLKYLPTDPQTNDDLNIIYYFNKDTNHYDYKSGYYK